MSRINLNRVDGLLKESVTHRTIQWITEVTENVGIVMMIAMKRAVISLRGLWDYSLTIERESRE